MKETKKFTTEKTENHIFVILLSFTFFIFSFYGIGNATVSAVIGILLCATGFIQGEVKTDLCMLGFILAGVLLCGISSFRTYGNFQEGYTGVFALYPVLYMILSYLNNEDGKLLRRICILWSEIIAGCGILEFLYKSFESSAYRIGGIIGNPNAMGIFLVVSWLILLRDRKENDGDNRMTRVISLLSPLLLAALTLTLSMGSFLSLCIGMTVYFFQERKENGEKRSFAEMVKMIIPVTAEMSLYIGTGILLFVAERKTDFSWTVLLPAVYLIFLCFFQRNIRAFFEKHAGYAGIFTGAGIAGGFIAISLRQSAAETFTERLEMMRNGLGYFFQHPLTGVGSYQWRRLNFNDGDKYFNTWHIHNIPIHFAAELGIFAVIILIAIFVHAMMKKENRRARPAFGAFICHNLMDTSFMYFSVTSLLLFASHCITGNEKKISNLAARCFYLIFGIYFVYSLFFSAGLSG